MSNVFSFPYRCVGIRSEGLHSTDPQTPDAPKVEVFTHHFDLVPNESGNVCPSPALRTITLSSERVDAFQIGDEFELTFTPRQGRPVPETEADQAFKAACDAAPHN